MCWFVMTPAPSHGQNSGEASVANLDALRHASGATPTADLRLAMQKTMQNHAAVFRNSESLSQGCVKVDEHFKQLRDDIKVRAAGWKCRHDHKRASLLSRDGNKCASLSSRHGNKRALLSCRQGNKRALLSCRHDNKRVLVALMSWQQTRVVLTNAGVAAVSAEVARAPQMPLLSVC